MHVVLDPRTGAPLAEVPLLGPADVAGVAARAAAAAPVWAGTPVTHRCALVRRMANTLERGLDRIAAAFSREHGKTLTEASAELARAVDTLRWSADHAPTLTTPTPLPDGAGLTRSVHVDPAGPVLAVVPWNFPAVVLARKLGPALTMGCPVVVVASERVPSVASAFADAAACLPDGVVRVLHTGPDGAAGLVRRPEFRCVSFTGSTAVGRLVAEGAATTLTPCVLELGGHAPAVVMADADLDVAVAALVAGKYASTGQSCGAPSRLLVHRSVADEFTDRLTAAVPDTDDHPGGTMGPLNSAARRAAVHTMVTDAVARGARLRAGGRVPDGPGFYYPATVLDRVPASARILVDEPFGPVVPVVTVENDDHAVAIANATPYALSAYIFGPPEPAIAVAGHLDAGSVSINHVPGAAPDAPLGGRRSSGHGYEGGPEGMLAFARLRIVQHALPHQ